ncbi:hypothetical protein Pcinc_011505 [Petrolisthes cinctipes]|uniref:Uncharacterized protein n=1 Tax=Petrolisthes cinctipes TaxID=88211 RepID=A0AAE1KTE6_PETCI|nr:hypothetical protein Pcinc_011505 [Petrolisthes cinctipes]
MHLTWDQSRVGDSELHRRPWFVSREWANLPALTARYRRHRYWCWSNNGRGGDAVRVRRRRARPGPPCLTAILVGGRNR